MNLDGAVGLQLDNLTLRAFDEEGSASFDLRNEVIRGTLITHEGRVVPEDGWPVPADEAEAAAPAGDDPAGAEDPAQPQSAPDTDASGEAAGE